MRLAARGGRAAETQHLDSAPPHGLTKQMRRNLASSPSMLEIRTILAVVLLIIIPTVSHATCTQVYDDVHRRWSTECEEEPKPPSAGDYAVACARMKRVYEECVEAVKQSQDNVLRKYQNNEYMQRSIEREMGPPEAACSSAEQAVWALGCPE